MDSRRKTLVLVGPPNSGKTTLFNWLTGSRARTVNYPGSTVEYKRGRLLKTYAPLEDWEVIDTPGIYGPTPKSPDELVTHQLLQKLSEEWFGNQVDLVVIAVCDGTHLSRHLALSQLLKMTELPTVIAVTMGDLLRQSDLTLDSKKLSQEMKTPTVVIEGVLGGGILELCTNALSLSKEVQILKKPVSLKELASQADAVRREMKKVAKLVIQAGPIRARQTTRKIDSIALHPLGGPLFFLALMFLFFSSIFWMAQPFMDVVDFSFGWLADGIHSWAPGSLWSSFLADGVVASVGGVAVFVPQIFILFFGLTLLEDSGYLARASALVDRPLAAVGLNGRAFTPLLSGFACAIPAMMAARSISNKKERTITLAILPLMSCSARLPVYTLLLAYLVPSDSPWLAGAGMVGLYLASILVGTLAAAVLVRFFPNDEGSFLALELPIYHRPRLRNAVTLAFQKTKSFATRAGPVIFVLAVSVWTLTTFPRYEIQDPTERVAASYAGTLGHKIEPLLSPMGVDWRVGVGLISAFAAREVFVSALAVVFHVTEQSDDSNVEMSASVLRAMKQATHADGSPLFTTSSILGLLVFFLIALQCLSTVATAIRESGSLRFAVVQLLVLNGLAYALAVMTVQGLRAVGVS